MSLEKEIVPISVESREQDGKGYLTRFSFNAVLMVRSRMIAPRRTFSGSLLRTCVKTSRVSRSANVCGQRALTHVLDKSRPGDVKKYLEVNWVQGSARLSSASPGMKCERQ